VGPFGQYLQKQIQLRRRLDGECLSVAITCHGGVGLEIPARRESLRIGKSVRHFGAGKRMAPVPGLGDTQEAYPLTVVVDRVAADASNRPPDPRWELNVSASKVPENDWCVKGEKQLRRGMSDH